MLLLAKTGFGKSLIFQLFLFITTISNIFLILVSLKLLQAEQSKLINRILLGKKIVLNGENNTQSVLADITNGGYTHFFTSLEIILSKKFKNNVLNDCFFIDYLCLLAIDEIYLIEEWDKNLQSIYTKIEKVQK